MKRTHCKSGHERTPENTCIDGRGCLCCKVCSRIRLLRRYGITPDDYDRMLAAQNGRCAICRRLPGKRALCVDHIHKTGVVRGLLCDRCNRAIGNLNDNHQTLKSAEIYLSQEIPTFRRDLGIPEEFVCPST